MKAFHGYVPNERRISLRGRGRIHSGARSGRRSGRPREGSIVRHVRILRLLEGILEAWLNGTNCGRGFCLAPSFACRGCLRILQADPLGAFSTPTLLSGRGHVGFARCCTRRLLCHYGADSSPRSCGFPDRRGSSSSGRSNVWNSQWSLQAWQRGHAIGNPVLHILESLLDQAQVVPFGVSPFAQGRGRVPKMIED